MRAWGKDLGVSLGLAYLVAIVVWAAGGGSDAAQGITIAIAWPLFLIGARGARASGWMIDQRISKRPKVERP